MHDAKSSSLCGTLALVTLVAAMGGFLFGYDTAVINGANQYLKAHFDLDGFREGLASASAILGCIPGAMFAGFISDRFGRRRVLFISAVCYAASAFFSAIPFTFHQFLAARFLGGLGIGASSMVCPVYIAELAPAARRGRLGSLFQLGIVVGIFLTLFINALIQGCGNEAWNTATGWRWMLGAEVMPAALLLALLYFAPESPRWLIQAGRTDKAREILHKIVGPVEVEEEIASVQSVLGQEQGRFAELFQTRFRRPLLIAVALMAFSQFSGINAIMYYSTKIFMGADVTVTKAENQPNTVIIKAMPKTEAEIAEERAKAFNASSIIGLVNLIFTFIAIALVDKAGRKPLLVIGLTIQVVALSAVGFMFHSGAHGTILLLPIVVYIGAFAMSLGPISWIVCSEIFPTKLRGRAMSIATFTVWTSCYIVAQTFPMLNDNPRIGPAITFCIYSACSLLGLLFVIRYLPETKGRSLEEIEQSWLSA